MNRYIPKTLMITPLQEEKIAEWVKKFREHHLDMSLSSIVRLLLEDHLDDACKKFPFFEGGND